MPPSPKVSAFNLILLIAALGAVGAAFFMAKQKKALVTLPIYGPREYDASLKDTTYHTVLNFKLTDQMGQTITIDSFRNKVFVANFFYATCPGICRRMNAELEDATKAFIGNPKVKFVSYTVNPKDDSVPVLAEYAKAHNAVPYQWYFLTGNKDSIYHLAWKSYFASVDTGNGKNFVHTENMVLVDMNRHLRGVYKGTDSADVARMVKDIKILLEEEN